MLDADELAEVASRFGVADDQVRRDHLISYLLGALSEHLADDVIFFGGTALARTHLPNGRLSEDLDLLAVGPRSMVVRKVEDAFVRAGLRTFGRLEWDQPLSQVRDTEPGLLRSSDGLVVRVQALRAEDSPAWPTEIRALTQRYSDAPAATLRVLTLPAFAGAKTAAWHGRHAPRDLFDLWSLALLGALDVEAAALFARYGPTGGVPAAWMFAEAPSRARWTAELAAQTRLEVTAGDALAAVRDAWEAARR